MRKVEITIPKNVKDPIYREVLQADDGTAIEVTVFLQDELEKEVIDEVVEITKIFTENEQWVHIVDLSDEDLLTELDYANHSGDSVDLAKALQKEYERR